MEVTFALLLLAGEGDLWLLVTQQGGDLLIGHIADLVIVIDKLAVLIANSSAAAFHECITDVISGAHIAVDSSPAVIACAALVAAHGSVFAPS